MKLTVDTLPCDLAGDTRLSLDYDAEILRSPGKAREGITVKLHLPHSAANDALFRTGYPSFNASVRRAELTHNGALLHYGTVRLLCTSTAGFTIEISGRAARWAEKAAFNSLKNIPLDYSGRLTPTEISAGWRGEKPVRFLPVLRDSYEPQNDPTDLQPALRLLTPDDYHPFLQADALLRAIFNDAGYTVQSRFMEGTFFRSLYLSGAYAARDTTAAEKRMGFRAVRLTTSTATADALGRVYATPYGAGNTVGNIVETATPLSVDEEGIVRTEPYNNGNCFGLDDRKIVYRPASTVSVAFEYRLRYTTEHRILNRSRLAGFDSLNLGPGGNLPFRLPNRYQDRRMSLRANMTYRVVVFGSTADRQYRLLYTRDGTASSHWADFTGRSALVTTPAAGAFATPVLYLREGGTWRTYPDDWALYDGHIGETGETTVELTLRTPAETVGPSSPKYFNTLFFYGAEAGMRFTLHRECILQPLFSAAPAYGAALTTADICRHDLRQIELIEAIMHLFNLRIFSDEQTGKVHIEPDADFWDESHEADWSDRTDLSQSIDWHDASLEAHESRTYGYRTGDGAAARLADEDELPFGSWRAETGGAACIRGDEKRTSPLFSPTVSAAGGYKGAPSALLPQVGDRDDASGGGVNFTPRIVCWRGLRPLPEGECWSDPSGGGEYPFAAFHFAGDTDCEGFTLCFEDRDGQQGLHRYYDREESILTQRRHVTLTLRLEPHEFESLFTFCIAAPDLRSVFRIGTDEGPVRATLRRIEHYDPMAASARCTFTLLPHDRP